MNAEIITAEEAKSLDDVTAWLASAKGAEYGFFRAVYSALYSFDHGNRDPLAKLLTVCNGKKGKRIRHVEGQKLMFAAPLKRVLAHCLANVGAKADASKDFGIAWTMKENSGLNHDKLRLVLALAQGEESPRGKTFRDMFPPLNPKAKVEKPAIDKVAKVIEGDDFPTELARRIKAVMDAWQNEQVDF